MNGFTNEFELKIIERVIKELKSKGLKQKELLRLCKETGIGISQSSLSKIYSGEKKLNLAELTAISKVVDRPIDYFVWGDEYKEDFFDPHDSEVLHNSGKDLEIYKGEFHLYFLSTAVGEDEILHGRLQVKEEKGIFCSGLDIYAGGIDKEENRIIKRYEGRILTYSGAGVAYFVYKSEAVGELCMICLRHRSYNTTRLVECRIGLALTMSAGEKKEPVAYRCLVVRAELKKEIIEKLRPWLHMISDEIRIERDKWEKLIEGLKECYPESIEEIEKVKKCALYKEYVEFDVDMLQKQLPIGEQMLEIVSELYRAENSKKNYMVLSDDDIRVYKRLEGIINGKVAKAEVEQQDYG